MRKRRLVGGTAGRVCLLVSCAVTFARADFDITDFSTTSVELTYPSTPAGPGNTASVVGSALQVTPGELSNVGAVWVTEPQSVTDGFTTVFEFEFLASPTGAGGGSGDGLAFVLQNDGLDAVGNHAAAMGYGGFAGSPERGINNSIAIELDDYYNSNWGDPDGNHISVHTGFDGDNTHDESTGSIGATSSIPYFGQGSGSHVVKIEYASGNLSVYFEDLSTPVLEVVVDLEEVLGSDSAWVGFTGSGGAAYQIQNVSSWSFTTSDGPTEILFRRGDGNDDGTLDITDAVFTLNFLFTGGQAPHCQDSTDSDDNGAVEITDAVYVLNHLFLGGPAPEHPSPDCGPDPTPDGLTCDSFDGCTPP